MIKLFFLVTFFTLNIHQAQGQPIKSYKNEIDKVVNQIKSAQNLLAAQNLLTLFKKASISSEKARIKYLLGLSFMELGLNQVAAFQFVESIRLGDERWTKPALEKLLLTTDSLGDETLLNFAIQRVDINQIPAENREMLYYRLAEVKHKSGLTREAAQLYLQITSKSRYYYNALYNSGLAYAESNQPDLAIASFNRLLKSRQGAKVTDTNKVSALMGIARSFYQKKDWDKAIEFYAKVPRDHALWHEALFEKTWAMLRAARFRSTLSNFQTLHSSYYEDSYLPETLLLRAIVYLYICQYDEMEKVLALYEKNYEPSLKQIDGFLKDFNSEKYFQVIHKTYSARKRSNIKDNLGLPFNILKRISEEGDVKRAYAYIKKINSEKKVIEDNVKLRSSGLGDYALKIINNRIANTKVDIANLVREHLLSIQSELNGLSEQAGFIRYEMINGKKESLKKKISGKDLPNIGSSQDRAFYIENGYEYYPFQGEYWLDEIGNYHYLGKQSCE